MTPAQFDAKLHIENKWYYWMENNYFLQSHRTPILHCNNSTLMLLEFCIWAYVEQYDSRCLIRRARLKGFNACWVPGTDHASIATEAKCCCKLKAEGINKADLTREEF
jgi:valyl-tRNA synthetase